MSDDRISADDPRFDPDDVPDTVVAVWVGVFVAVLGVAYLAMKLALALTVWAFASP